MPWLQAQRGRVQCTACRLIPCTPAPCAHQRMHAPAATALQSLSRLVLNGAALAGGRLPPEFAALHSLRCLELRACRLAALPSCVAALPGLTSLDLGVNRLADLPGED